MTFSSVFKIHIDHEEMRHVLSPAGSSVDVPPVLGSFCPFTINTPSRWGPAVLEHHFPLVSFICLPQIWIIMNLLLLYQTANSLLPGETQSGSDDIKPQLAPILLRMRIWGYAFTVKGGICVYLPHQWHRLCLDLSWDQAPLTLPNRWNALANWSCKKKRNCSNILTCRLPPRLWWWITLSVYLLLWMYLEILFLRLLTLPCWLIWSLSCQILHPVATSGKRMQWNLGSQLQRDNRKLSNLCRYTQP